MDEILDGVTEAVDDILDKFFTNIEKKLAASDGKAETLCKDLRSELEGERTAIEKRLAEVEEVSKQFNLQDEIKALEDLLVEEREKRVSEVAEIRKYFQTVTADRERLEKSIESLKSEIAERDERIESLSKALADAQQERERVDGRVEELAGLVQKAGNAAELESIAEKLSSLESSLSELNERVAGCMKFAGQWDEGEKYETGATVAHKNSLWVAMRDNPGSPGTSDSGWKMCIKSGKLITPYEHR